jgi:gas vesicle protein
MALEKNGFTKGLVIGLLAGGVVGAITALLYAPKSGKELRSDLKQKANDLADEASEYVTIARTKATDTISKTKHRADELASEVKEQADHILDDAEKVMSGIRDRAQSETGKVKSAFRAGVDAYRSEKDRDHNPA